jgi:hypothetical protein
MALRKPIRLLACLLLWAGLWACGIKAPPRPPGPGASADGGAAAPGGDPHD